MDSSREWTCATNFLVLVNHMEHDIKWVSQLKFPYIVYTKDEKSKYNAIPKGKSETNLLKFIIDFYEELPENIVVVHDREYSFYHDGSLVNILNDDSFENKYNSSKIEGFWNWNTQKLGSISMIQDKMRISGWWSKCMEPWLGPLEKCFDFSNGKNAYSQFVVSKDRILSLPLAFYTNMYNWINNNTINEGPSHIDPITGFRDYPKSWIHPNSSHYIGLYLSYCWELIFVSWKPTENISVVLPDGRKLFALYGSDGYFHNVTRLLLIHFFRNGSIVIPSTSNFNDIFGDNIYGCVKSLRITIDDHTTTIMENRLVML